MSAKSVDTNDLRNSTETNIGLKTVNMPAHTLLKVTAFILLIFALIINFAQFRELVIVNFINLIFTGVNLLPGLSIQTQGVFATFNMNLVSIFITILFILAISSSLIFKEKAAGITTACVWLIFMPIIVYVAFVGYGSLVFSSNIVESMNSILMFTIIGLIFFTTFVLLTSSSQDAPQKINKEMEITLLVLAVLWIVLLFASDSPFANSIQGDIQDGQDDINQELNNFATFWQCQVMGGEIRGVEDCIQVKEEVNVEERASSESFSFSQIADVASRVIREGRESTTFGFEVYVPRAINNLKITSYSCIVGSNRTSYNLPSQYSSLTQRVESGRVVTLQLDCPVMEKVSLRDDTAKVGIRINVEAQDRIVQNIPYIDCDVFSSRVPQISCDRSIARALALNRIDNPQVVSFLRELTDPVTGAYTVRASVSGIRGNLPFYLNSDTRQISLIDYDVIFREDNDYRIGNVSITNIETPPYISIVEESLLESVSKRDGDDSVIYPIGIEINDFSSGTNSIGGSEAMLIDYVINHYIEATKTVRVEHPPGAVDESIINVDVSREGSQEENQDINTQMTPDDEDSQQSCTEICGGNRNRACIANCEQSS